MTSRPPLDPRGAVLLNRPTTGEQTLRIPEHLSPRDDHDRTRMETTAALLTEALDAVLATRVADAAGALITVIESQRRDLEHAIVSLALRVEVLETIVQRSPVAAGDYNDTVNRIIEARQALGTCDGQHPETDSTDGCCPDPECWQGSPQRAHDMLRYGADQTPEYQPGDPRPDREEPDNG